MGKEFNSAVAHRAINYIEQNPGAWNQLHWRCNSGMCFAGIVCTLEGGKWAYGRASENPHMLKPLKGQTGNESAESRAAMLLGINRFDADNLFSSQNSLGDLRRIVAELEQRPDGDA